MYVKQSIKFMKTRTSLMVLIGSVVGFGSGAVHADDGAAAYKINGKVTSVKDVYKREQSEFYEIEKRKYETIERLAREDYLDAYWQQKAKESNTSVEAAKKAFLDKKVKVSASEVKDTLSRFKDHPQLKKLSNEEQERQVRDYLEERKRREVLDGIVDGAMAKGDLAISYPKPEEPVYAVSVKNSDPVKYGPTADDTKPVKCEGDHCPITVVEYSEFQCPFCSRVMPSAQRVLTEYKGQVRWIVRDFPLSFHDRAKPAAIAAKCAAEQGKYWKMYETLFQNQSSLSDADFDSYAGKIGLDKGKFTSCVKNPASKEALIEENMQSGIKLGVTGTPAYFINGRRLSGALPFEDFKKVIDDEIAKANKKDDKGKKS